MFLDRSPVHGQVLALFELPELSDSPSRDPGLNHFQFRHANLAALLDRVELLLGAGLQAHRASNHGPVTSYYFSDPDQNVVELCCNNFDDAEKLKAFIDSDAFKNNPSGIDVDPKDFLARFRAGEPLDQLLKI
ncbi:biphenyl 2,3-dioxygenase (plasmid) [Bradyrhizobium sp. CCBAU 53351]|nr:biphenyl 2,3-dioxygenase [Bradyrhizobium sp. CCBAU 53351]